MLQFSYDIELGKKKGKRGAMFHFINSETQRVVMFDSYKVMRQMKSELQISDLT